MISSYSASLSLTQSSSVTFVVIISPGLSWPGTWSNSAAVCCVVVLLHSSPQNIII